MAAEQDQEKEPQKIFRLQPREAAKLDYPVQIAHLAGRTPEPTLQAYMMYALNLAYVDLKQATGH